MSRPTFVTVPLRDSQALSVGQVLASSEGTLAGIPADGTVTAAGITFRLSPERGETRWLSIDFKDVIAAVIAVLEQEEMDRIARLVPGAPR